MAMIFRVDAYHAVDLPQHHHARLSRSSLLLRQLLADPAQPREFLLPPDPDRGTDAESIDYLLKNLGKDQEPTLHGANIVDLSRLCNTIHHLKCDPDPFRPLWGQLPLRWAVRTRPADAWCWRQHPRRDIRAKCWEHHAVTAWVLGKDDEFSDALNSIVFSTTQNKLQTSVEVLRDVQEYRHRYMKRVFNFVTEFLHILHNGSAKEKKIAQTMVQRISASPHLKDIHLTGELNDGPGITSAWDLSFANLSSRRIYAFVLQLDFDLLRDTSKEFDPGSDPYGSSSSIASTSQNGSDTASTTGALTTGPDSPKVVREFQLIQAIKGALLPKHYTETVERMFKKISDQIVRDQAELASLLLDARNRALDERRTQLTGTLSPANGVPYGAPPPNGPPNGRPNGRTTGPPNGQPSGSGTRRRGTSTLHHANAQWA